MALHHGFNPPPYREIRYEHQPSFLTLQGRTAVEAILKMTIRRLPSPTKDVRLPNLPLLQGRFDRSSSLPSAEPKALTPGVLNIGVCAASMLICKAFGVFAPKVYRAVLKNGGLEFSRST